MKKNRICYRLILLSVILTGIASISNQIIFIREFLTQFCGNELTISTVIFIWLFLSGLGSLFSKLFKKASVFQYCILLIGVSVSPLFQLLFIRLMRNLIFAYGEDIGFYQIIFYVLITGSFYPFIIGFILPYSQKAIESTGKKLSTGSLYILDNIGDIIGGALFSLFLVYILKPFQAIGLTSFFIFIISLILLFIEKRNFCFIITLFLGISFFSLSLNEDLEKKTLEPQYGNIISWLESPFGRIVITKEDSQFTFWESGLPLYIQKDIATVEEKVHYPLSQLKTVNHILLISGGFGRTIDEIKKYRPKHIDYVELDPFVIREGIRIGIIRKDKSLSIINTDGRYYLRRTKKKYSAIIIDLPEPDTFQINRFFTKEFFLIAKSHLEKGGVISLSMNYSPNYISKIRRRKISILYNTLKSCFKNVLLIPGNSLYFLASDSELSLDIPELLRKKGIKTTYVENYFRGNITSERISYIKNAIIKEEKINSDLRPYLVEVIFKDWFLKYQTSPKYFFLIFFFLSLTYLALIRREEYILFSTGFSLMGIELLIIFLFQIIFGYIYIKIGIIITFFLLGLFPGAFLGMKIRKEKLLLSELLILLALSSYAIFLRFRLPEILFLLYSFLFSFFCGMQFPVVAKIIGEERSPAASCFAADLIGGAVGTILIGIILIPAYGLLFSFLVVVFFKLISLSFSFFIR